MSSAIKSLIYHSGISFKAQEVKEAMSCQPAVSSLCSCNLDSTCKEPNDAAGLCNLVPGILGKESPGSRD